MNETSKKSLPGPGGGRQGIQARLTESARSVLGKRYLKKDENGKVCETAEDMFLRVAENIAAAEALYGRTEEEIEELASEFYKSMCNLDFLPNSPTLMNAGRELGQLAACFVLPVEDSMESIFEAIKQTALIHKTGGGTGFSFNRLRPKNDPVASTGGVASGPISFMKVFNSTTDVVKQGGTRRGANMGILRVDHPDIMEFITAKDEKDALTNFNLSVAVTDEFMDALRQDRSYSLRHPATGEKTGALKASDVFAAIVEMAWKNGEPGIIFIDRINSFNPTPHLGDMESTNPCGEQPLLPYEACNLGSLNLSKMTRDVQGQRQIDWDKLRSTVNLAVRFLDDVIDVNRYPLKRIEEMSRGNRKIGLGVMGFADLLLLMEIPYNSERALKLAADVMQFIKDTAMSASEELAQQRGAFPNFSGSIYKKPIRNATVTTIAPTGSISIIAGCSSGIEPLFALSFVREIMDRNRFTEVHPIFEETARQQGFHSEELIAAAAENGTIQDRNDVPMKYREIFVTSHDISPQWHVRMQAAFQKYTDNAVSKTVNFPAHARKKDIEEVFLSAYTEGCKGITVYRYGSRDSQVLNLKAAEKPAAEPVGREDGKIMPRPRPAVTAGTTEKFSIGCGNLYVTVNADGNGEICEVFTQTGKGGGCPAQSEAVGRLVSIALRSNVDPISITEQLKGVRCLSCTRRRSVKVLSCPDAIARAMEKIVTSRTETRREENSAVLCPECSQPLEAEGRCFSCRSCGYSKCG